MGETARAPIQASWKVSEVISRYPQLLDELVALNPTFRLLRNPVMRRVQSRLVTVAQAAMIAGMEPVALVQALNRAIGIEAPGEPAADEGRAVPAPEGVPAWVAGAPIVAEVDARPLQREGREPFSAIMAAARQVAPGEGFRLWNTFEPVPLYDVLGQRGFVHHARQHGPDDWEILFFRIGNGRAATPSPAATAAAPLDWSSPSATVTIDVSGLVPPEPMIRILEALEALPPGGTLLVHHVRRPMHLYPRLDALGYRHETRELGPGRVELLIEKTAGGEDRS
ncbi:MAG: DUF2249 domain-containing protein [Sphaerobacter sp.]|nr:DUF2249 domain-containing protein [Sphaerobacter sp.]